MSREKVVWVLQEIVSGRGIKSRTHTMAAFHSLKAAKEAGPFEPDKWVKYHHHIHVYDISFPGRLHYFRILRMVPGQLFPYYDDNGIIPYKWPESMRKHGSEGQ